MILSPKEEIKTASVSISEVLWSETIQLSDSAHM